MLSNIASTKGMVEFLSKIVILSRNGKLPWESTADPDILIAPLGGGYVVRLHQVPDFGEEEVNSDEPDHIVSIYKDNKHIVSFDRRDFGDKSTFRTLFSKIMSDESYPYHLFKELWSNASFKSSKVLEEVQSVNKLLDAF